MGWPETGQATATSSPSVTATGPSDRTKGGPSTVMAARWPAVPALLPAEQE
jgi:hypothetical protein